METCVGCGSPLAPSWKFCIHCGLAVESPDTPDVVQSDDATPTKPNASNRALVIGGVGIFLVGIALLVVAIAVFASGVH